jgi:hypothetical protein
VVDPDDVATAYHEGSHAVVGVRAGLPIDVVFLGRAGHPEQPERSLGQTRFAFDGQTWEQAFSQPNGRRELELHAAACAAGMGVHMLRGGKELNLDREFAGDMQTIVEIAGVLGIGRSRDDPAVLKFLEAAIQNAVNFLSQDEEAALERVAKALMDQRSLTGEEVRTLVSQSDMARAK